MKIPILIGKTLFWPIEKMKPIQPQVPPNKADSIPTTIGPGTITRNKKPFKSFVISYMIDITPKLDMKVMLEDIGVWGKIIYLHDRSSVDHNNGYVPLDFNSYVLRIETYDAINKFQKSSYITVLRKIR